MPGWYWAAPGEQKAPRDTFTEPYGRCLGYHEPRASTIIRMTATRTAPPPLTVVPTKGLRANAIGLRSAIVIGVASTAPAYSLTAALGHEAQAVGTKAPVVLVLAFVPMLCISYAYRALNQADPDCGTSFTWTARALGRRTGWLTGWVYVSAGVVVVANVAQVAATGTFTALHRSGLAAHRVPVTVAGCGWILAMTAIAWAGVRLSARAQAGLLVMELLVLAGFSAVALARAYLGGSPATSGPSVSWFDPAGLHTRALSTGFLIAVFIYWGWDAALSVNEETRDRRVVPGRAAVASTVVLLVTYLLVTVAALAYAGAGARAPGLTDPATVDEPLSAVGAAVSGRWGREALLLAILVSATASAQTTILSTARTTLAMAVHSALPHRFAGVDPTRGTPAFSTWAAGLASVAFYALLNLCSPGALDDLVTALGMLVAFYYGLTGLASAWLFRGELLRNARSFWSKGALPVLGCLILFGAFTKTAVDSYATGYGETTFFGVGGVFVLGVGSIAVGLLLTVLVGGRPTDAGTAGDAVL